MKQFQRMVNYICIYDLYDHSLMKDPVIKTYYDHSHFLNVGYWPADTQSQQEACENLMEKLLEFLPRRRGIILDVACGMGGTTRYLTRYFSPSDVIGINISIQQLSHSKVNAPGCQFCLTDAARIGFADRAFDIVICVEAAFHFNTRARFLHEAWRVLKPGGHLILSDILFSHPPKPPFSHTIPAENICTLSEYKEHLDQTGFQSILITDEKEACWDSYCRHMKRWAMTKFFYKEIDESAFRQLINLAESSQNLPVSHYPLVCAQKP